MRRFLAHVIIFCIFPIIGNILFAIFFPPRDERVTVVQQTVVNGKEGDDE